jgi:hypothetical protein
MTIFYLVYQQIVGSRDVVYVVRSVFLRQGLTLAENVIVERCFWVWVVHNLFFFYIQSTSFPQ